jgi:hypothetical protein
MSRAFGLLAAAACGPRQHARSQSWIMMLVHGGRYLGSLCGLPVLCGGLSVAGVAGVCVGAVGHRLQYE